MTQYRTEIKDRHGDAHVYTCTPYTYRVGLKLGLEIGGVVSAVFRGDGMDLSAAVAAALEYGGPELAERILSTTARDGVMLSEPGAMDSAYQDAGYLESLQACAWVVGQLLVPFGDLQSVLSGSGGALSGLLSQSEAQEESPTT